MKCFSSDDELVEFATTFAATHIERFKKDINVCCTPDQNGRCAWFPALMACIGVLDLFSGLYAGKMDNPNPNLDDLKSYAREFLPRSPYSDLVLSILYACFRHKVAHMAHPYDVFDTSTKPKIFAGVSRMLITWNLDASSASPAINIEKLPSAQVLQRAPKGWGVVYDHMVYIHIRAFADDVVACIEKPDGYLNAVAHEAIRRKNFEKCMNEYFPA